MMATASRSSVLNEFDILRVNSRRRSRRPRAGRHYPQPDAQVFHVAAVNYDKARGGNPAHRSYVVLRALAPRRRFAGPAHSPAVTDQVALSLRVFFQRYRKVVKSRLLILKRNVSVFVKGFADNPAEHCRGAGGFLQA